MRHGPTCTQHPGWQPLLEHLIEFCQNQLAQTSAHSLRGRVHARGCRRCDTVRAHGVLRAVCWCHKNQDSGQGPSRVAAEPTAHMGASGHRWRTAAAATRRRAPGQAAREPHSLWRSTARQVPGRQAFTSSACPCLARTPLSHVDKRERRCLLFSCKARC